MDCSCSLKTNIPGVSTAVLTGRSVLRSTRKPGLTTGLKHRRSRKATQEEELIKLCQLVVNLETDFYFLFDKK